MTHPNFGVSRRMAHTAPTLDNVWSKVLAVERRLNLLTDANGVIRYTTPDGQSWSAGTWRMVTTGAVTINLTSLQLIGTGVLVQAGVPYDFWGVFRLKQGTTGLIAGNVGFASPAISSIVWFPWWSQDASSTFSNSGVRGDFSSFNVLSQAPANSEVDVWYQGSVTFSASGTWTAGCTAASGHTFVCQPGTKFVVSMA